MPAPNPHSALPHARGNFVAQAVAARRGFGGHHAATINFGGLLCAPSVSVEGATGARQMEGGIDIGVSDLRAEWSWFEAPFVCAGDNILIEFGGRVWRPRGGPTLEIPGGFDSAKWSASQLVEVDGAGEIESALQIAETPDGVDKVVQRIARRGDADLAGVVDFRGVFHPKYFNADFCVFSLATDGSDWVAVRPNLATPFGAEFVFAAADGDDLTALLAQLDGDDFSRMVWSSALPSARLAPPLAV